MKKFAISFVVILFLLYNTNMFYKEASALGIGKEAAPFILKDLEGNEVKLADFRGKKVVLHFFMTWCPSCQEEMPLLVRFYEQMDQKKAAFLGINLTKVERNKNDVALFMKQYQVNFPVLLDEKGHLMNDYHIFAVPVTMIINENGVITKRVEGMLSEEIMEEYIKKDLS